MLVGKNFPFWLLFYLRLMDNHCVASSVLSDIQDQLREHILLNYCLYINSSQTVLDLSIWIHLLEEAQKPHNHINYSRLSIKYVLILVLSHRISNTYCLPCYIYKKDEKLHFSYLFQDLYVRIWNKLEFHFCHIKYFNANYG